MLKELDSPLALYLLDRYPLAPQFAALDPAELASETYDGARHVGAKTAEALVRKAGKTVGRSQHAAFALRICATVAELRLELTHLDQANQAVAELLDDDEQARLLRTVPGIGPVTAATVLSEVGDIHRFRSYRQLVAFAGLSPRVNQSGKRDPGSGKICKVGPPNLRKVLWMAAQAAIRHDPAFKALYERLVIAGKAKRVAIGACAARLLRVVFAVVTRGTAYENRPLIA